MAGSAPGSAELASHQVATLAAAQSQTASRVQLLRLMSEEKLRAKVASGRWQVPHAGVVVMHSGPISAEQQLWVDLLCCGQGAVLAGLTAATADGLTGIEAERPQILVPHRRQVTDRCDLDVHSSTRLGSADVHPLKRPKRTKTPRSFVDAASWASHDAEARAILAAGVQQRLVRAADMLRIADAVPNLRRRKVIRLTLRDIGGGAHSLPELDFTQLCRDFDLPLPSRQVTRQDSNGRRRWLDVFWDEFGLVVEIDGLFHMEASQWWSDMWRGNEHALRLEGVLRYPSFAIRDEPERVAGQVADALRARGWSGST
jgi:very-short-patch-repair endonuclease